MKKLSTLLQRRAVLLEQARLANLALAYRTLDDFARRIARGRLVGPVTLEPADTDAGRYWATLTAREGSQAVIEEHFADEDLMDLADIIAFVRGAEEATVTFRLEDFAANFVAPVRAALEREGVATAVPARSRRAAS
jgi:hypothetical protein